MRFTNIVVCVNSKDSDQPAYMHSLIRTFASPFNILFNSIQFNDLFTCHLMYKHKIQTYKHNTKVHKLLLKSYETR